MKKTEHYFRTIHRLIRTGHQITEQISIELKEYGISEPQYNVLRMLIEAKGKPLTVQEILEGMVQRSSNVTRIIDKLVDKGYVNRQECPSNRRKMDITITTNGAALLEKLDRKVYAMHQPMIDRLNVEELEQLSRLMKKLNGS